MPPYAERKIRLAATIPSSSICVSRADDPVGAEEQRREQRERRATPTPTTRSISGAAAHAGLPNSPNGRTASTIASSTNVKMIE